MSSSTAAPLIGRLARLANQRPGFWQETASTQFATWISEKTAYINHDFFFREIPPMTFKWKRIKRQRLRL